MASTHIPFAQYSMAMRRPALAAGLRMSPHLHAAAISRRTCVAVAATMKNSRTSQLRKILAEDDILLGPCCHDALSARLIEHAGFPYAFMSGFCTAGARLGAPDTGLISYAEMLETGRCIHEATRSLPVIGDGDTGYGNAMNVKRTVRGYAQAGFAGILIEDQIAPKSCGHVRGKRVVGREEAVSRIRAAVDAREEGADILIVARTDARQAVSLEEALWRVQAFADAGADVLFIDALESEAEMRAFTQLVGAAAGVPKMANMLEGGGKTPLLTPSQLSNLGFRLVAYPLSLLGVSIRAMQDALVGLKRGRVPPVEDLGTFAEIQAAVGFPEYYQEEQRYAISQPTSQPAAPGEGGDAAAGGGAASGWVEAAGEGVAPGASWPATAPQEHMPVVEPEVLEEAPPSVTSWPLPSDSPAAAPAAAQPSLPQLDAASSGGATGGSTSGGGSGYRAGGGDPGAYRRSRNLRVRISDASSGLVKLETRVPAGFLNGLTALVPQVAGFDIEALLDNALAAGGDARPESGQPLLSLPTGRDVVQIFLE